MVNKIPVLDHGYVLLRNISGPTRRPNDPFDADSIDPANSARFSFDAADKEDRPREADLKLVNYLIKNKHTTPIEMIEIWLEMKMPIFVARQFVRHRTVSINEVSARYVQLPNEFYIPNPQNVGQKSESNKQGRNIEGIYQYDETAEIYCKRLAYNSQWAYSEYERAINAGIPNELARCFLPVNIYTKWLWKQDLHNLMHFIKLRDHSHAQYESQQYAKAIKTLLKEHIPELMEMYEDD